MGDLKLTYQVDGGDLVQAGEASSQMKMTLKKLGLPPEIIRKGGAYGVKLKAGAPSIHMVRVDIDTEINPMVGDEKQSQDLVNSLMGEDPEKLWHKIGRAHV